MSGRFELVLVRPVPFVDALSLLHRAHLFVGLNRLAVSLQCARSELAGVAEGDRLIALAGFAPMPGGGRELWFVLDPAAKRHLKTLIKLARLTFPTLAQDGPVVAHVRCGHAPGRKLAILAGLSFASVADGLERWEAHYGRNLENVFGQGRARGESVVGESRARIEARAPGVAGGAAAGGAGERPGG